MDLDLRKLRYFVAVAEHRHFGRAAARLYIAQPVLSRQVRALEQELGCTLLTRTSRSVELTDAGAQLLEEARGVFAAVDGALRRVHEVDRGVERLVVAFAPGLHVSEVIRAYAAEHPEVDIDLLTLRWWEQDAPLRDGRADVGYLRRPFDDAGLWTEPVGAEARVAYMAASHPLAGRDVLRAADLDGLTLLDPQKRQFATIEEKFEHVAASEVAALVPESVARTYSRPDLVAVPLADEPLSETCLVVPEDRREQRVLDFLDVAREVLRRPAAGLVAAD
jgi:DNA-binding transcriptional LysR family regulator